MAYLELFSFISVLKESIILLPRNGKLMVLIAISSMFLSSTFFWLFHYYLLPLLKVVYAIYAPLIGHMREDVALLITAEIASIVTFSLASFFLGDATILVATMSYRGKPYL